MTNRPPHDEPAASAAQAAALAAALRREAQDARTGPAPVEEVVRAGRARRRRNRAAAGVTAVAVLAAPLLVSAWPTPGEQVRAVPAAPSPTPSASGARLHTVAPYEPVAVAPDLRLGLLPEGRQNYVLVSADAFAASLDASRSAHMGDSIRPRSISGGYAADSGAVLWLSGVWRLPEPPARVVVTAAGRDHPAALHTLPGDPGWGTYFLDARALPRFTSYTVTAYDASGHPFDTLHIDTTTPDAG
ncbi:hypothetical protein V1J52_10475 [Streptomyces sp. TRM 70351]|uniref:hypothetical protein n=1 Tax=Streptomyces sp. TRM 70351 TaxID=3116552 RepID=UPI002E7C113A|nr:hypothetical protein [Streptomyces sp. TRM 70351]MEE1928613.1 hypothetical protein [Streptomyces sp. TRM 70351]